MKRVFALTLAIGLVAVTPLLMLLSNGRALRWWPIWSATESVAALRGTLVTAGSAAALAFGLGFPLAVVLGRTDLPFARALRSLFTLPAALPPFILGMGWIALANPKAGLLNLLVGPGTFDIYGAAGISLVLGTCAVPVVLLPTLAALAQVDPALEEAARLSGAGPLRALLAVSVPLALPAGLSGASLALLFAASAFGVPYLLGVTATPPTPTLTTRIYSEVLMGAAGLGRSAVLSMELLGLAAVVLVGSRALARGVRLSSGKGVAPRPLPLGRAKAPIVVVVGGLAVVLVILPLLAVVLTSLQPVWGQLGGLTVKHWSSVLSSARTLGAARHSVLLSLGAASLVTVLGLAVAETKRGWLEALASAPSAVPGTVLALAWVVAFSRDLRFIAFERIALVLAMGNTLWLVLLAYTVKHLAFGARNASDGLAQVDPSLTEAARLSGASPARAFFDATLPQVRAPLTAAFVVTFLTCMTELTMSVLLIPTGSDVLGTLLFDLQSYADPGSAAVIACSLLGLVMLAQLIHTGARERWPRSS
jgi:iron(III) transport system permease protein